MLVNIMKTSGLEPEPCSLKVRHSANRVLFPLDSHNYYLIKKIRFINNLKF